MSCKVVTPGDEISYRVSCCGLFYVDNKDPTRLLILWDICTRSVISATCADSEDNNRWLVGLEPVFGS
jgi:hypothetical protein